MPFSHAARRFAVSVLLASLPFLPACGDDDHPRGPTATVPPAPTSTSTPRLPTTATATTRATANSTATATLPPPSTATATPTGTASATVSATPAPTVERFSGTVDEFYAVPDPLPPGEPGALIRVQDVSEGEAVSRPCGSCTTRAMRAIGIGR